ncbi:hypothetical protein [Saccharothrix sp. HUAS TT1]|uniref:hypothetical protein n=1 Tax=unclassified Saccharothrix TaxID=2593673 RepID=UPI00345BBEC1
MEQMAMGKFWDDLKLALKDQIAGSMKYGASTSYRHNRAAIEAARAEREAREARERNLGNEEFGANGTFEGHHALIESGYTTDGQAKVDIYYGGRGGPLGKGHGHLVKLRDGDSVVYWRLPQSEGGRVITDNRRGLQ